MMRALIAAALRLRVPVVALSVILMVVGIRAANNAPFDVFPEFAPPLVEIQTEAPGLSSADVEALIASDFAPVQGFVLIMAALYVALNLGIDMLYGVIDPRVRISG